MLKLFTKQDIQDMVDKGMSLLQIENEIGVENIGQGFGYKSEEAYILDSMYGLEDKYICYIPEYNYNELPDGTKQIDINSCYTKKDFIELTGDKTKAEALFQSVDWQHPSSLWDEWDNDFELGEIIDENILTGSYAEVHKSLKDAYIKDDVELAEHFATCKAPDLTIEDTVKLYSDLKHEIDGDRVFEFKDETKEVAALWSKDEPFCSQDEVSELFSDYVEQTDPLMSFIEQEVPYRLNNYLGHDAPKDVVAALMSEVQENTDVMFDYDRFDSFLEEQYEKIMELDSQEISALRGELNNLKHELNGAAEFAPDMVPKIERRMRDLEIELNKALKKDFKNNNFIDDEEKMKDFNSLSKEEFLQSYNYLTEEEYENTKLLVTKDLFIFDEEVLVNDDNESLNGYLWAVGALVGRLDTEENKDNINFYADYNLKTREIKLTSSYYILTDDGELNKVTDISLTAEEKQKLIDAFNQYCYKDYGKSCLDLLNAVRIEEGLEPLVSDTRKPNLSEKIQSAEERAAKGNNEMDINNRSVHAER